MFKKMFVLVLLVTGVAAFAYNAYSARPLIGGGADTATSFAPQKAKGSVIQVHFYAWQGDAALLTIFDSEQSENNQMRYCTIKLDARGEAILSMINAGAEVQAQNTLTGRERKGYPDCGDVSIYPIMH